MGGPGGRAVWCKWNEIFWDLVIKIHSYHGKKYNFTDYILKAFSGMVTVYIQKHHLGGGVNDCIGLTSGHRDTC